MVLLAGFFFYCVEMYSPVFIDPACHFHVNLTQARVSREEGDPIKRIPKLD